MKAGSPEFRNGLLETSGGETNVRVLGDNIAKAEDILRRSLQQFPNDPVLLTLEGDLSAALSQAERTESAFKKALVANPHSTLVARRLARIQNSKGAHLEAVATLRASLEANPASSELQYDLALSLMSVAPDADQTNPEEILYHLRRAFTPGDKSYQAQFFYARQLCLVGKYEEAKALFARLSKTRTSFQQKRTVRGYVLDQHEKPKRFDGSILVLKPAFGFIQCSTLSLNAYFELQDVDSAPDKLTTGMPVSFELGFNLRGPVANEIRITS